MRNYLFCCGVIDHIRLYETELVSFVVSFVGARRFRFGGSVFGFGYDMAYEHVL